MFELVRSRVARSSELRAGDEDREQMVTFLRASYAAGRLTEEELSERVGRAYAARTLADLLALTRDLPGAERPPSRPIRSAARALKVAVVVFSVLFAGAGVLALAEGSLVLFMVVTAVLMALFCVAVPAIVLATLIAAVVRWRRELARAMEGRP